VLRPYGGCKWLEQRSFWAKLKKGDGARSAHRNS
jgi:hypothetical protein